MSCKLGLAVGESFAELIGFSAKAGAATAEKPFTLSRWYLPKKSLADGLKEAMKNSPQTSAGGQVLIASNSVDRILDRRQGRAPGVLVTSGFETWLGLSRPTTTVQFSPTPRRAQMPLEQDAVFGMSERVSADGRITAAIDREELEFIVAKLQLLKVKDVAVCYLNADANPENELTTAAFLRDKGFRVFLSHQQSARRLDERWLRTVEASFAESAIIEEREEIDTAFASLEGRWELFSWTSEGPKAWAEANARSVRDGLGFALSSYFAARKETALHCGLDAIELYAREKRSLGVPVRLTQTVGHGTWPFPNFTDNVCGYEPGPMLFGRSHQLAALDILFVQERLREEIDGFTPLLAEKSRPRILETLLTLTKLPHTADKRRAPDPLKTARELEKAFIEEIALELGASGVEGPLKVTGPLAAALTPLLRERRPDLKIDWTETEAWCEARAALAGEAK